MVAIGFWLACGGARIALPLPSGEKPSSNGTVELETVDLTLEFGVEWQDWYYHLNRIDIPKGGSISLPEQSGWAVLTEGGLQQTGFYPQSSPESLCAKGCVVLSASIDRAKGGVAMHQQVEQNLSEGAPQKSNGLNLLDTWSVPLTGFPTSDKSLRMRAVELEPGGNVGQHKHNGRPSFAYIVGGDVIEHRGDGDTSYHTGDRVAERNGLVHWWENGDTSATIVVFDIIPSE